MKQSDKKSTVTQKPQTSKAAAKKPAGMSYAKLEALAHQKRGMGELTRSYVSKSGPITNDVRSLNPSQMKQLKDHMSKSSTVKKIYQGLPNIGRMVGKSAADVPTNKNGGKIKKKIKK